MAAPLSRADAPRYSWGAGCDGWHLCRSEGLSVIEERMPPGTQEVRHTHAAARQVFYVLEGSLDVELDRTEHRLHPGQSLEIAPGRAHQALNRAEGDVRFLVISSPPAQGDRVPMPEAAP